MYRIEKLSDHLINGKKDLIFYFEFQSRNEAEIKLGELAVQPHFGTYQLIEETYLCNEHSHRVKTKDNKTES